MSQETVPKEETAAATAAAAVEAAPKKATPPPTVKPAAPVQALIDSLKSVADDIGQISELTSEEKLLVAEFFKSLLKLMQPLTTALPVSTSVLQGLGVVIQAHIDPTGHLAILFDDGRLELKDLSEEKNRDLMLAVVEDTLPKFKNLTGGQKRKVENRIKFLSSVTKEMQKISETLSSIMSKG